VLDLLHSNKATNKPKHQTKGYQMKTCPLCGNATLNHLGVNYDIEYVDTNEIVKSVCRDCYDKALGR
jgi:C4-type Zn-finger protein